ncbi:sideroflexin-1-3 isoform X4 [Leguminivora glycinivorella]|uniref:sideroflexin-1-3 isoform X4 n=1 Tax=Leguminivora glycinivorella TaxID=1035111 RepID=UPI00201086E8|nr:sideroflexin-1-3 isoform X4 [Leguminivora glycinivorella]
MSKPIDLSGSQYDQDTYIGRAKHFFKLTNPLNIFATSAQLDEAKQIVTEYKKTKKMPPGMDEDKLWSMKYLYDSAFHPDTGEKMFVLGRMAAQAPMNTLITGCMITFYKTNAATMFWQWINQTFNALVNYTNRSGTAPISKSQLLASYCAACGGAMGTAFYLNSKAKRVDGRHARVHAGRSTGWQLDARGGARHRPRLHLPSHHGHSWHDPNTNLNELRAIQGPILPSSTRRAALPNGPGGVVRRLRNPTLLRALQTAHVPLCGQPGAGTAESREGQIPKSNRSGLQQGTLKFTPKDEVNYSSTLVTNYSPKTTFLS